MATKAKGTAVPPRLAKLQFFIDDNNYFEFCNERGVLFCYKRKPGITGKATIEYARKYHAALAALLAEHDGNPLPQSVTVRDWGVEGAARMAAEAVEKCEAAVARLREEADRLSRLA